MKRGDVSRLYLAISDEYNRTPLAAQHGWVHRPTPFGLMEMQAIASHFPSQGVLVDIGTGSGIGPLFAHRLGGRVISIDSLASAGTLAIENIRRFGIEGHYCDVERDRIPVDDNVADCVLFTDVIEHLLHSPRRVLKEINRVLKPGGVCISTTPNALRLTVRIRVLMGYSNWPNLDEFFERDFHAGHHHEYTIEEFKGVFRKMGFDIAEFILYENSLRSVKISGLDDLKTHDRGRSASKSEPFLVTLGKKPLLALTAMCPQLRSNMLLIAKKPFGAQPR